MPRKPGFLLLLWFSTFSMRNLWLIWSCWDFTHLHFRGDMTDHQMINVNVLYGQSNLNLRSCIDCNTTILFLLHLSIHLNISSQQSYNVGVFFLRYVSPEHNIPQLPQIHDSTPSLWWIPSSLCCLYLFSCLFQTRGEFSIFKHEFSLKLAKKLVKSLWIMTLFNSSN